MQGLALLFLSVLLLGAAAPATARQYVVTDWTNALDFQRFGPPDIPRIVDTVYVPAGEYDGPGLAAAIHTAMSNQIGFKTGCIYGYAGHPDEFYIFNGYASAILTHSGPHRRTSLWSLISFNEDADVTQGGNAVFSFSSLPVIPFGSLDTPAPNQTVSGTIDVWGWVLAQIPSAIPADGHTITVFVDGIPQSAVTYSLFRSDVAAAWPGYANSSGAVFRLRLDTCAFVNGTHTISFSAYDDLGRGAGIGSRYFLTAN